MVTEVKPHEDVTLEESSLCRCEQNQRRQHSRISRLSSLGGSALKASLVGAKRLSAPCWLNSSVIPAACSAPTRRLGGGEPEITDPESELGSMSCTQRPI